MSDSVWPHRWQPTRLHCPWDSPGKNTGVGCHFLLQCTKVKSESEVTQSCLTLHDPMDCSLPGSSVHGIFQARVLEWGAIAFSIYLYIYKILWGTFMLFFTAAVCMHAQLFKLYVTLWMVARQVLLSMDSAARTSGETIALSVWIFVGKVMFLLLNTLSRFGIAFLPRSRCLLISWL